MIVVSGLSKLWRTRQPQLRWIMPLVISFNFGEDKRTNIQSDDGRLQHEPLDSMARKLRGDVAK
eukprot:5362538-Karenia_brevis.AAC.1